MSSLTKLSAIPAEICRHREAHGLFSDVTDLMNVKKIGRKK